MTLALVKGIDLAFGFCLDPRAESEGLDRAGNLDKTMVFHAGTARRDGTVVTAGGRVLGVSALGEDLTGARDRAYRAVSTVSFEGMHHRTDIAEETARGG